jgi:hypothetical protein
VEAAQLRSAPPLSQHDVHSAIRLAQRTGEAITVERQQVNRAERNGHTSGAAHDATDELNLYRQSADQARGRVVRIERWGAVQGALALGSARLAESSRKVAPEWACYLASVVGEAGK